MATAFLVTASRPALAVAMVVALGATLAGIFPAVLGGAGSRFPAHSGTVFGILFTMALAGRDDAAVGHRRVARRSPSSRFPPLPSVRRRSTSS